MVSESGYDHKPTQTDCANMVFTSKNVTLDELSVKIKEGYSFCPTRRKKEEVDESGMIVIDIDNSHIEMNDFVSMLTDTPSLYYTTPNNLKDTSTDRKYRFRLVYATAVKTKGVTGYDNACEYIISSNRMREILEDDKSVDKRTANQMYNGSVGCEIHTTGRIYEIPEWVTTYGDDECEECKESPLSPELCRLFSKTKRIGRFLSLYEDLYGTPGILYETPYIPSDIEGMLVPACDYMCVPRKYGWFDQKTKRKVYVKWKDGENRHGRLWLAGLVMRILNPFLSADELFYGYVKYIYENIDLFNSDRSIKYTRERILCEFSNVMNYDIRKFKLKKTQKHSSFKVDPIYCHKKGISKREALCEINTIRWQEKKESKYELIDSLLSKEQILSMTNKQCVEFLLDNGLKISLRTFSNYLYERNINKRNK